MNAIALHARHTRKKDTLNAAEKNRCIIMHLHIHMGCIQDEKKAIALNTKSVVCFIFVKINT